MHILWNQVIVVIIIWFHTFRKKNTAIGQEVGQEEKCAIESKIEHALGFIAMLKDKLLWFYLFWVHKSLNSYKNIHLIIR